MTITFVRHAEVEEEYLGKYNGHIDISLSKNGHIQAQKLAFDLKDENFDAVYCSDLKRARETLDAFKLTLEPIFTDALREKSWGIHEGKSFQEIEASGIKYESFEQWINALDGENIIEYKNKVRVFLQETLLKSSAKNILVLSHSGFIKTLLGVVKNLSLQESFNLAFPYAHSIKKDFNRHSST